MERHASKFSLKRHLQTTKTPIYPSYIILYLDIHKEYLDRCPLDFDCRI